jgi:hypothetical protein
MCEPAECLTALFAVTRNVYAEMRFVVAKPALAHNTGEILDCHQGGTLCAYEHGHFVASHVDIDVFASNSCLCRTSEACRGKQSIQKCGGSNTHSGWINRWHVCPGGTLFSGWARFTLWSVGSRLRASARVAAFASRTRCSLWPTITAFVFAAWDIRAHSCTHSCFASCSTKQTLFWFFNYLKLGIVFGNTQLVECQIFCKFNCFSGGFYPFHETSSLFLWFALH